MTCSTPDPSGAAWSRPDAARSGRNRGRLAGARPRASIRVHTRIGTATRGVMTLLVAVLISGSASAHRGDPLLMIPTPDRVTVTTRTVPGLGRILTNAHGHALYMFLVDPRRPVTCTGACAGTWPPLAIAVGHHPTAAGGAESRLLGTIPDPNTGALDVTYDGYPLYLYANDIGPDTANGQALESDGGPWFVLRPSGRPIHHPIPQSDSAR